VLLIRRGKPPAAGLWSFPGGSLHRDEALVDGAAREVSEETGLAGPAAVALRRPVTAVDVLRPPAFHYVVVDVVGFVAAAAPPPVAADDAAAAAWVPAASLPPEGGDADGPGGGHATAGLHAAVAHALGVVDAGLVEPPPSSFGW